MLFRRRLIARFMLLMGVAACVALPAPAFAGGPSPYQVYVQLQDYCVVGVGPVSSTITLRHRTSTGVLKGKVILATDSSGEFEACFWELIEVGDQIAMTNGSVARTVTAPNLTMNLTNTRVADVVAGKGPANSQVQLEVFSCQDYSCDSVAGGAVATASTGAYTRDFTSAYDIRGRDSILLEWSNSFGDTFALLRVTPFIYGRFGSANVSGRGHPEKSVTVQLLKANGNVRGKFTDTGETYGGFIDGFLRSGSGSAVPAAVGNSIKASFSTDAVLPVINSLLAGNADTNVVTGKCFPNQYFYVYAEEPGQYDRAVPWSDHVGTTNGTGNFTVDFDTVGAAGFDLTFGDLLFVECRTNKGDELASFGEALLGSGS